MYEPNDKDSMLQSIFARFRKCTAKAFSSNCLLVGGGGHVWLRVRGRWRTASEM